ncbi:MAG TPA: tetratricopeptide repeat protein [Clostridiaceae bacterium]|nr:tetratricopeptide repeat protein [Clostridiaceae bacterium]
MINFKKELEEYSPIQLEFGEQEHEIPDNIKNSAILYNKALENLKIGSEDIAIIGLKKAVSMNPEFLKAMNLLGLAYCIVNDFDSAAEVFRQVIDAEKNSVKALEYLNSISSANTGDTKAIRPKKEKEIKLKPAKSAAPSAAPKEGDSTIKSFKFNTINYLLGAATGVAIIIFLGFIYFFFLDTGTDAGNAGNINNPLDTAISQRIREELESEYKEQLAAKDNEIGKLEQDLEAAKESANYLKNVILLNEVKHLFALEEYEKAADRFIEIKDLEFTGDDKKTFDKIKTDEMNKAIWSIYNQGLDYFKKAQYSQALERFVKVEGYVDEWSNMDWLLYHMGVCYKELNDSRKALEMFEKIKDEYQNSGTIQYVNYMIDQITNKV